MANTHSTGIDRLTIDSLPTINAIDEYTRQAALRRLDTLTKPLGALGRLEALAAQICAIQGTLVPALRQPHALIFAGDHGAADRGVSAYPRAVTAQMVANFLGGGAAINVLARAYGLELLIVDAGVDGVFDPHPQLLDAKIRTGTRDYLTEPAMTHAECETAMTHAHRIVTGLAERGTNVVVLGEMGIGNTASASLLMHGLGHHPLSSCVGRGTGLDDDGVHRKISLLETARARAPGAGEPVELLCEFGGYEIAMLVGAVLGAASARMTILVDGFTVTVAAALAARLQPQALDYCVFCHRSAEQAHRALLKELGVEPLLDLGLRLGEGSGGALGLPLVRGAIALFSEMATFDSAGVSGQVEA
jgi:nicotinate-nucleotide--dimethylbenzimidazole phosphoribosyltransferase